MKWLTLETAFAAWIIITIAGSFAAAWAYEKVTK